MLISYIVRRSLSPLENMLGIYVDKLSEQGETQTLQNHHD